MLGDSPRTSPEPIPRLDEQAINARIMQFSRGGDAGGATANDNDLDVGFWHSAVLAVPPPGSHKIDERAKRRGNVPVAGVVEERPRKARTPVIKNAAQPA